MHTVVEHPIDAETASTVAAFLDRVATQFPFRSAILFGSRARGVYQPESDADVAVVLAGAHGAFMTTKLALADIAFDVMLETGIRIEALPLWEDEWAHPETYRNPYLLQNIVRDGVLIR